MTPERILLIDALNNFLRAFAVVPSMDQNGEHIGGLVGFIRIVKGLIRETQATRCIVIWDGKGGSQKRRGIFNEYKAGRRPKVNRHYDFGSVEESEKNMRMQLEKTKQFVDMLGLTQVEIDNVEADDVIAFLSKYVYSELDKVIVSTDKDMLQLIDRHTVVYSPSKKIYYSTGPFKEEYGILPENYIYMKALVGDGSDNIDGIKGVGPKSVVKLFPFLSERPSSLQEVLDHAATRTSENPKYRAINDGAEVIKTNVSLMQLSNTIISAQSALAIRQILEKETDHFVPTEFKITLIKEGIQLTDADMFVVFRDYHVRSQERQVK